MFVRILATKIIGLYGNLDSHIKNLYIYYVCKNYCKIFNIHISRIYHVSYPIILKINVSIDVSDMCRI